MHIIPIHCLAALLQAYKSGRQFGIIYHNCVFTTPHWVLGGGGHDTHWLPPTWLGPCHWFSGSLKSFLLLRLIFMFSKTVVFYTFAEINLERQ